MENIIESMLKESTGTALCDSGGSPKYDENGKYIGSSSGYGRHWEINKYRDFQNEPESKVKFTIYNGKVDVDVTHNIYHWLNERVDLEPELDELFHGRFLKEVDPDDSCHWLGLMEEFPEWLSKQEDENGDLIYGDATGIYGNGNPFTDNVYNHENLLSQIFQFTYFELPDRNERYVILQIHGGCDVRGGYTDPHVFAVNENMGELSILDWARGSIYCDQDDRHPTAENMIKKQRAQKDLPGIESSKIPESCDASWNTDDGYHLYSSNNEEVLDSFEAKDLSEDNVWEPGKLCMDADGNGYCPYCGGKLKSSSI